jgi:hypothetical protein
VLLASLLMLLLLLANIYYFWLLAVAGLPSAVDYCDVPVVSAAVVKCTSCEFLLLLLPYCWCPCLILLSSLLLLTVLLSGSGGPTAVDIHDVPIVPAAAVISDLNSVPAVVGVGYWTQKNYRLLATAVFS